MGRPKKLLAKRFKLLVAVLLADGVLLGTMAGMMNESAGGRYTAAAAEATEQKWVALTFDDGPHKQYTEKLLDGLKERGIHATFFLMGENIEGKEALVKRMQEEGHLIGNHSFAHQKLTSATENAVCESVERTGEIVDKITGVTPHYLRPPYGAWNDNLECRMDMTTVFWTVDSLDWKFQNTNKIVKHVLRKTGNNDIILMHDIFPTSVEAALQIVDILSERGYTFVTVDELLID